MKVEYVCVITLDQRDVRLASANGGMEIPHPVPPVKTIIKVTGDAERKSQTDLDRETYGFRVSASESR